MTFTPHTLRKSGFPHQSFSHEHLLKLCRYYKNLLSYVRQIQSQIDGALDEFHHSQYGRASEPLTKLITTLATIDARVREPLLDEIMEVELSALRWEGKSAKLRSEAKRQQRIRAKKRGIRGDDDFDNDFAYTGPGVDPFAEVVTATATDATDATVVSPTMALALKGMKELPSEGSSNSAPDTSGYKKSGLV
jgi:hypothetical protein